MSEHRVAALILAGGRLGADLETVAEGATNRALIPLAGRPMLEYVLDAVRAGMADFGGGRVLVAGDGVLVPAGCVSVPGGESMVDTLLNGAAALGPYETRMLVVTADAPFLTGAAVGDFLARAAALGPGVQFAYAIVEAARCRARFPEMKRTTLRVAEGEYTGGCLALLDPGFLLAKENVLRAAYANRKSVPALARMLGPSLIGRLLLSRAFPGALPIPVLERAVGRLLGGAEARAVVSPHPEVGADVDKAEDVRIARRLLEEEAAARPARKIEEEVVP
jgi:GTP:adenosylcobinamide-phosphate guanylyltransferase